MGPVIRSAPLERTESLVARKGLPYNPAAPRALPVQGGAAPPGGAPDARPSVQRAVDRRSSRGIPNRLRRRTSPAERRPLLCRDRLPNRERRVLEFLPGSRRGADVRLSDVA